MRLIECMRLGETRHIRLTVYNRRNEPFEIIDADYTFTDFSGNIIDSGKVTIIEHMLDVLIHPPAKGDYVLYYAYSIGDERRISVVEVRCI